MARRGNPVAEAPKTVSVSLEGSRVGTAAMTPDGLMAFSYAPSWIEEGFSISPFSLPLAPGVRVASPDPLEGVFGVIDDAMPDGWGRLLLDRSLRMQGVDPRSVGVLERLCLVGDGAMGALSFEPSRELADTMVADIGDLDRFLGECRRILDDEPLEDPADVDRLRALAGSSGGARPKALVSIEGDPWIVKFPTGQDGPSAGVEEYAYMACAAECGLDVPETRLLPSEVCPGYFAVRRFDRTPGGGRVHMVSAGGLLEVSHRIPVLDYENLFQLTDALRCPAGDRLRLFRLMCFNVFSGNLDDHAKNFSYLRREGAWELAPAYDLTPSWRAYGTQERACTVAGKGSGITVSDLVSVAEPFDVPCGDLAAEAEAIRRAVRTLRRTVGS